jgi:hypothetical protein
MKRVKQLNLLSPQTLDEALHDLHLEDVPRTAEWLRHHTPSAAFLLCLGSGPWPLPRREKVQTQFLSILRRTKHAELTEMVVSDIWFQLDWQRVFFMRALNCARSQGVLFNTLFNRENTVQARANFIACFTNGDVNDAQKVLCMFARDYVKAEEAFPVDRHVRTWLADRKLPRNPKKMATLLREHGVVPAQVSRAIFGKHSSNPVHAPTIPFVNTNDKPGGNP